jgi:cytoskeleton protein RodZ
MADIGTTLRDARMRARIDISEVEASTKIRAKYLRAIENEQFDLLPGPVYVKSFLRTYGDFLGLDSRMLVEEYKRRYEQPPDYDVRPVAPPRRERDRDGRRDRPRLPSWAPIGFVLAAVVVALYLVGSAGSNKSNTPASVSAKAHRTLHHHTHPVSTPAPPPPPTNVTLVLVPIARVYVCLVDGAGKQLIPGQIFDSGQAIPTKTASKLLLTLGNASVQMKVNGKTVSVAPSPNSIGYLLGPTGVSSLPAAQQPRCA